MLCAVQGNQQAGVLALGPDQAAVGYSPSLGVAQPAQRVARFDAPRPWPGRELDTVGDKLLAWYPGEEALVRVPGLHRHRRFDIGDHIRPNLWLMDDDGLNVKESQHIGRELAVLLDDDRIHLMAGLQGDERIDHRCFGKVLELERGVTGRVAGQDPLAVHGLVVLLEHDGGIHGTGDAEAVAPGHRQVQQGKIARHLAGDGLVDRRHAHVRQGERDGQVLEEEQGDQEHGHQAPEGRSWPGRRRRFTPLQECRQTKCDEHGQAQE